MLLSRERLIDPQKLNNTQLNKTFFSKLLKNIRFKKTIETFKVW